jgi:hypothetical protein
VIFTTATGSQYEVDAPGKRIRQIHGPPTDRINRNGPGTWASYQEMVIKMNKPALIFWPNTVQLMDGSPIGAAPITYTSPVQEVDFTMDVKR